MSAATTAARAAAEWWAEQIGSPVQRLVRPAELDAGSMFAEAGLAALAARHPVPAGAGAVFADELEKRFAEKLDRIDSVNVGVDYGPDWVLAEAAEAAGIDRSRFPVKTHMWFTKDYVTAALGYGRPVRLIWTHPDWVRPACGMQRYDEEPDGRYEPHDEICSLLRYHDGDHGDYIPDPNRCKECGGTYADHYRGPDYPAHSWQPDGDDR